MSKTSFSHTLNYRVIGLSPPIFLNMPRKGKAEEAKTAEAEKDEKKSGDEKADTKDAQDSKEKEEGPTDRDICFGLETHKSAMLLEDLIRLHYMFVKKEKGFAVPTEDKDAEELAARLTTLLGQGKQYELSGLKDVPKPFVKREGKFYENKDEEWVLITEDEAKAHIKKAIIEQFKPLAVETPALFNVQEGFETLWKNTDPESKAADDPGEHSAPRPCDVLFLPVDYPYEENMPYEHQSKWAHSSGIPILLHCLLLSCQ